MNNYEKFDIKTLKKLYRNKTEILTILKQKLKIQEKSYKIAKDNYDNEEIIVKNIEKAMKKKGILPNQIDIEEISEKPLTNEEN